MRALLFPLLASIVLVPACDGYNLTATIYFGKACKGKGTTYLRAESGKCYLP